MIVECYVCNQEFEVGIDEFIEFEDEEDNKWICDECCDMIREWVILRN